VKTIFWDVDTQVDFMVPGGKLYVPGAERMAGNLERLTRTAEQRGILIVASACAHRQGDPEFEQYPPHCIAGTPGQRKIPQTTAASQIVIPNRPAEIPAGLEGYAQVIVEKQQFDVFSNPNTGKLLERLGRELQVVLYGVVTEICVASAARGLQQRGLKIALVRDAIRHLDEIKSRATVEEIERRGGTLVATEEVVSRN